MKKLVSLGAILLGVSLVITGCTAGSSVEGEENSKVIESTGADIGAEDVGTENIPDTWETSEEDKSNLKAENTNDAIIEITEKMYVTYVNEIYTNTEAYEGKTIKLEGMFTSAYDESTKQTYYFVYRTGPGCCNNDGSMCGFEFTTNDVIPVENDWIEVVGSLETYEENGYTYLNLKDAKVTIKEERGQEVVYQ